MAHKTTAKGAEKYMNILMKAITGLLLLSLILSVLAAPGVPESYYGNHSKEHLAAVERHHLQQGRDKAKWDNPTYAWRDVEFILRHFPNHPDALMLAIDLSLKSRDMSRARELFEKAVIFDPMPAAPWVIYGLFFHRHGQLDDAIMRYQEALKRDPNMVEAHYNLGLAYFALKQYEKASQAAQRAYALGYPLLGLRKKLENAGKWQAIPETTSDNP